MSELKPCPFCGETEYRIQPGGQTWRGVAGYSAPQYFHLYHTGTIPEGDGFQMCAIQIRARTEAELLSIWNTTEKASKNACKGEKTMSDDLMKCLGKGVADVDQQQDAADRIEELEAKLAKAVEALEAITFECVGDEARCGARAALAELKGEK